MQDDLDRYIAAAQLGITLASLALGWIGEGTIAELLEPPLRTLVASEFSTVSAHAIAVPLAFVLITFLMGEVVRI